ncbi:hypothetical protein WG66_013254 [Moniliophthora roreri]|nr:hypothetical protein WG66_013254 [Moniliophthora roreri]
MARKRINLKKQASQIRSKDLVMEEKSHSLWKIYLGFRPALVSDTVAWYKEAEDLERGIQSLMESDAQHRLQLESAMPGDAVPYVLPVSSCEDATTHRQHGSTSFRPRHRHRRPPSTTASAS